ncbi:hypothetical protein ACLB1E_36750 [Escherichia coli]
MLSGLSLFLIYPEQIQIEEKASQALRGNQELKSRLVSAGPFDVVYERYSLWSFAGMEYARNAGIPGILGG